MTSVLLQTYTHNRQQLLVEIVAAISQDDHFVAAWLTGSYGRSRMEKIMPEIIALGGFVHPSPMPTLESLLNFAKETCNENLSILPPKVGNGC